MFVTSLSGAEMSFEIPEHFHQQFTTNVELLLQEKEPMLLRGVETRFYTGDSAQVVKQFGEVEFQEKTTRHGDTNFSDIDHKQRWIFPSDHDLALPVDKEDEIRMLDSPVSPYAMAMRAAYARHVNRTIRDAAIGSAQTGKKGTTVTTFDTGMEIAVDFDGSNTNLTVKKLIEAKRLLGINENDDDEPAYMAVTANQLASLLNEDKVTNSDYNTIKALVAGEVNSFMGFEFLRYNNLTAASNIRKCIYWKKSGLVFGMWNGLETHIDMRPDKKYLTQVFMKATTGATRTQEKKVGTVLCDET